MKHKQVLGRGIGALFPTTDIQDDNQLIICAIEEIKPNRHQPRKLFDDDKLKELTASVKEKGVIQPLLARRVSGGYELIAGERRWRAAGAAGLKEVPVIIRNVRDVEMLELALVENIQRAELNPIEEAEAYQKLIDEFDYTQEELSRRIGKERSTITNFIRLLRLPVPIRVDISRGVVSTGHAKAILSLDSEHKQLEAHSRILNKSLSVRETESLVKKLARGQRTGKSVKKDIEISSVEDRLTRSLGTKIRITGNGRKGRILIDYYSADDLDRLIHLMEGG